MRTAAATFGGEGIGSGTAYHIRAMFAQLRLCDDMQRTATETRQQSSEKHGLAIALIGNDVMCKGKAEKCLVAQGRSTARSSIAWNAMAGQGADVSRWQRTAMEWLSAELFATA